MSHGRTFRRVKHVHMIGIGGAGMCGIAEVLLNRGFIVSGSDLTASESTVRLERLGVVVQVGHTVEAILNADVVVYSSAVRPENVELRAARDAHIPTIPRSEMLAELMRLKTGIAIAGTHGKTTTTSLIGTVLQSAGYNPTVIVGGIVKALDTGAAMGAGEFMVVEADEFDRSFLKLSPTLAVITTVEAEHLDTYGDLEAVKDAFVEFANKVPFYGVVVVCGDSPEIQSLLPRFKRPLLTYGFGRDNMLRIKINSQHGLETVFTVETGFYAGAEFHLQIPGKHNVLNAAAAIGIAAELDITYESLFQALREFTGVRRRFELKGEVDGVVVVDDYAHHPTEIENVLHTARTCFPERRIVALFQPHLFTRTRDFHDEFGRALALADVSMVTDIYPARERPLSGIDAGLIVSAAVRHGANLTTWITGTDVVQRVRGVLRKNDALIVMGAGDITRIAAELSHGAK
jgi:UDP-N-acetylmuramate--alanine ligase